MTQLDAVLILVAVAAVLNVIYFGYLHFRSND